MRLKTKKSQWNVCHKDKSGKRRKAKVQAIPLGKLFEVSQMLLLCCKKFSSGLYIKFSLPVVVLLSVSKENVFRKLSNISLFSLLWLAYNKTLMMTARRTFFFFRFCSTLALMFVSSFLFMTFYEHHYVEKWIFYGLVGPAKGKKRSKEKKKVHKRFFMRNRQWSSREKLPTFFF